MYTGVQVWSTKFTTTEGVIWLNLRCYAPGQGCPLIGRLHLLDNIFLLHHYTFQSHEVDFPGCKKTRQV